MVFKRKKRPEISKPTNFQHVRKTYFDINSQTLKDLPPQWTSILTDEDITRTAVAAYEKHIQQQQQQQHHHYSYQQARPKPLIGDACFLTPSDLEHLKVRMRTSTTTTCVYLFYWSLVFQIYFSLKRLFVVQVRFVKVSTIIIDMMLVH
jgi:hypothetical protein